jgi:hypothetical protein
MTTKTRGRKAIDGATEATERVNVVLTQEHRRRLELLAPGGYSAWVRRAIDNAWAGTSFPHDERKSA